MNSVCKKHQKEPVTIYGKCIGCEIVYYQSKLVEKEKEVAIWKEKEFQACSKHHEYHEEIDYLEIRIEELQKENKGLKAFHKYFTELYGDGLQIANWHKNSDLEPFDNFYEEAEAEKIEGETH